MALSLLKPSLPAVLRAALLGLGLACGHAGAATITIACGGVGSDFEFCKKHAEQWASRSGHTVKLFTAPSSTTDTLALIRQNFAARSSNLDVIMVDVVWPGIIKDHLVDLRPHAKGAEQAHFPHIVANNTVDGRLLAMPWYTDAGLLYYRKDLLDKHGLKPPATWQELADTARKVVQAERAAGNTALQGFVFQGKAYEGLTCNALEWVNSFGGGTIVDARGDITINNPRAVAALQAARSWIGDIAPTGVLSYAEDEARGVFQSGRAVFMRNWPYAWALSQGADSPVKGKVGVRPLPSGGPDGHNAATLGGYQLAVSKYSKNPEAAAGLVMFLTSAPVQKERAIQAAFNPTIMALYQDRDVLAANPFYGELFEAFSKAVPRPSTVTGAKYTEVSSAFFNTVSDVLSGKTTPEAGLKRLEGRLNQVKRGRW